MAESNANWDEHLSEVGFGVGAAHFGTGAWGKQAHLCCPGGEAGRSLLSRSAAFAPG